MATTRSSITRFLRAAVSHRNATSTLRSHSNLRRVLHTFAPASPLSFLRSHPSNIHFFSTFRTRPTQFELPKIKRSTVFIFSNAAVAISVCYCFVWANLVVLKIIIRSLDDIKKRIESKVSLPDLHGKGRSVVLKGYFKLLQLVVLLLVAKYFG